MTGAVVYNSALTLQCRVTYICVIKLATQVIIDSDNNVSAVRHWTIILNNAALLRTHFSEILIKMKQFLYTKVCLKMFFVIFRPLCVNHCVTDNRGGLSRVQNNVMLHYWLFKGARRALFPKYNKACVLVLRPVDSSSPLLSWFNFNPSMEK